MISLVDSRFYLLILTLSLTVHTSLSESNWNIDNLDPDKNLIDLLLADIEEHPELLDSLDHLESSQTYDSRNPLQPRRPEQEESVPATGYQQVSGGAGEGQQQLMPEGIIDNLHEVKSDSNLPSYCSPPNPCPYGKTAADGCQENIPDTADFNKYYMMRQTAAGVCECDYEHMTAESCPQVEVDEPYNWSDTQDYADLLKDELLQNDGADWQNPYISVGEKRMSLTAKKGANHLLYKRAMKEPGAINPYLAGEKLPVVAKKSPIIRESFQN